MLIDRAADLAVGIFASDVARSELGAGRRI